MHGDRPGHVGPVPHIALDAVDALTVALAHRARQRDIEHNRMATSADDHVHHRATEPRRAPRNQNRSSLKIHAAIVMAALAAL